MKLEKRSRALASALALSGALGVASQAHALDINPADSGWILGTNYWTTLQNSTLITGEVASLINSTNPPNLGLAYKQDYEAMLPPDTGSAAMFYSTTFNGDQSGATITWDMSAQYYIACPSCYLVVKDGNHVPAQYVFDISGWNGQETLNLSNFWPANGAISFVTIYNNAAMDGGGSVAMVPEAETYGMMLAGLGLVAFAARRRLCSNA